MTGTDVVKERTMVAFDHPAHQQMIHEIATGLTSSVSGPQGAAVPLTREQKLERAITQIRPLAEAWADPNAGDEILAILDNLT